MAFNFIAFFVRLLADLFSMDLFAFLREAFFLGTPHWSPEQVPDQSGRTIIITGGNSGIGKECAKALLHRNANVYLACRNQRSAEETIEELWGITGKRAQFLRLDLADLTSVRAAAEEFMRKEKQLHVLFNNAGIMFYPMEFETDGYDTQIYTNALSHFYFTKLLLPTLLSTVTDEVKPRIVTLTSSVHHMARANPLDFNSFKVGPARDKYMTEDMYVQSKFANLVLSNELARRYGDKGLICTAVNPGNLKSNLDRHIQTKPFSRMVAGTFQIHPVSMGAITPLWAGTAPETAELNGKYLIPWARVGTPRSEAQDPALARDLWEWMEGQISGL